MTLNKTVNRNDPRPFCAVADIFEIQSYLLTIQHLFVFECNTEVPCAVRKEREGKKERDFSK